RLGSYCGVTIVLNFRFQLTLLGWEICNCFEIGFGFRISVVLSVLLIGG
ncbi:hypothetical protein LINPERPRIM_LOCUS14586, partial [Linum perenne]